MILRCDCAHTGQDDLHGKGLRVHNQTSKVNPTIYRCTVCKKERAAK